MHAVYRKINNVERCLVVGTFEETKTIVSRINNLRGYMVQITSAPVIRKHRGEKPQYTSVEAMSEVLTRKELEYTV